MAINSGLHMGVAGGWGLITNFQILYHTMPLQYITVQYIQYVFLLLFCGKQKDLHLHDILTVYTGKKLL